MWRISNQLAALGLRDASRPVGWRRLFGRLTKVFALSDELVARVLASQAGEGTSPAPAADADASCTARLRAECPDAGVCAGMLAGGCAVRFAEDGHTPVTRWFGGHAAG